MQVRWTKLAAEDLKRITSRIRCDNPGAARRKAKALYDGAMSLDGLPNRGRVGRIGSTRELVVGQADLTLKPRTCASRVRIFCVLSIKAADRRPRMKLLISS